MTDTAPALETQLSLRHDWLYWLLVLIAAMTVISGVVQASNPAFILKPLKAEVTATTQHFFGIVGMFMVLFGGLMLNALLSRTGQPVAVLWGGFQKFGAFAAVALGVWHGIFSSLALVIAFTDLASGALALFYWMRISR